MKVILLDNGKSVTVQHAVADKLYPEPYSYEGELEKLKKMIELQSELIAILVDKLCENGHIKANQLDEMLRYGYQTED